MTKNVADSLIRKNIVEGDYQPVDVKPESSAVDIVAPLDSRSSACSIVRSRGKDTNKPRFVIIHGTTPGVKESTRLSSYQAYLTGLCVNQGTTWKYFNKNYNKPATHKGGSGHYTIFKDGMIAQHINEKDPVKQCEAYNMKSIGIEHHFIFGREPPTEQMYKASAKLVRDIVKRYKMLNGGKLKYEDVVLPHDPKYDPGPYWDWGYFLKLLDDPNHNGTPRSKGQTEANLGTDWQDPSLPSPSYGPRKRVRPGTELPFYRSDNVEVTKDEIENGILPLFLDRIVDPKDLPEFNSFFHLNAGSATPLLSNFLFGKEITNYKEYASLTNIELSNFVPFVELYLIKEDADYMYPFDDYTSRASIEAIFKDKTGRGGAVGIKNVSFKSLATNQSNLAQQTVKISFLIQDIQEIEESRNGVSLLDFLYPAGSRDPHEYSRNNFNVKMKVGWKYKKNSLTSRVDDKIEKDMLEEVMYLSLFKHSFEFNEKDGTVTLDVEYIGMLEAELDDKINSNVAHDIEFSPQDKQASLWRDTLSHFERWKNNKTEIKKSPQLKHWTSEELDSGSFLYYLDLSEGGGPYGIAADGDMPHENRVRELIEEQIKNSEKQQDQKIELGYVEIIKELFKGTVNTDIKDNGGGRFIYISKENLRELQSYYSSGGSVSLENINKIQDLAKNAITKIEVRNKNNSQTGAAAMEAIEDSLKNASRTSIIGNIKENYKAESSALLNALRAGAGTFIGSSIEEDDLFVPYTFLGNILELFYSKIEQKQATKIVVGSFSYSTIPESIGKKAKESQGGATASNETYIKNSDGVTILPVVPVKKYSNILNIPITFKSFDSWYRSNIIEPEVKMMSFHEFMKKILFELVPQNINPQIIPWVPGTDFTPSIRFETICQNEEIKVSKFSQKHFVKPDYVKRNPFYHFYKKRDNKTKKECEKMNYLFILSKNEISSILKGNPAEDIKNNILHLYLGEETGLVKNIKFSREDNKQLDAANIVLANKTQGKPGIIRQIYQLKLSMFGNAIFSPGTLLHISPTYPGSRLPNSTLYKIGLGGYYFVTQVTSTIEDNSFTTSVEGKWQTSGQEMQNGTQYLEVELSDEEVDLENKTGEQIADEIIESLEVSLGEDPKLKTNPMKWTTTLKTVE